MLTLTPEAASQIREAAARSGAAEAALRVAARRETDGSIVYGMGFDEPREGDMPLDVDGIQLLIAPPSQALLQATRLDFVELEPGRSVSSSSPMRPCPTSRRAVAAAAAAAAAAAVERCPTRKEIAMNSFVDMTALLARYRVPVGKVFLVGAGPGDADLLTVRAARLLAAGRCRGVRPPGERRRAGVDVARSAERIYVGKERGNHSMVQSDINALLVRLAHAGRQVVRLKGGDPFVFGRGGEELQALAAEGITFEVVPGITAACGVASYAGIPLTHRDHAQACLFVTGHLKDGSCDLDWPALARARQTVVIYMGLGASRRDLRAADRTRPAGQHASGRGGAGHDARSARGQRHPGRPGRARRARPSCDHRA